MLVVDCEYKPHDNARNKSIDLTLKSASSLGMKVCTNSSGPMLASLSWLKKDKKNMCSKDRMHSVAIAHVSQLDVLEN